ncbi:hypothetical protein ALC60_03341, partial [Trachymyrmex zeteki]
QKHKRILHYNFLKLELLFALSFNLCSDSIQVPASLASQFASTKGCLLNQFQLLQALECLASDTTCRSAEVAGMGAVTFASTKDLGNGTDSDWATNIDMTHQGCTSDVVPVRIIRSQFLEFRRLHNIHPFWNPHFAKLSTSRTFARIQTGKSKAQVAKERLGFHYTKRQAENSKSPTNGLRWLRSI